MNNRFYFLCLILFVLSCNKSVYNDGFITYQPVQLSAGEKKILAEQLNSYHEKYDSGQRMITKKLIGWNYHTDAEVGIFHDVRASLAYAVMLLDEDTPTGRQRAFDVTERTIALQDRDSASRSCGVWPYYLEEPLFSKKSPIDFNWADFNAVSLLDILTGHYNDLPDKLKDKIKESLILAAKSIQKRNVGPGYTNIAIMGTYVTYMVSHLYNLPDMKKYAEDRLRKFYTYTIDKKGFTEYNSPTYTIVALDELDRMKRHIVEPAAKQIIDSLYSIGWEMIARHYHNTTGQWSGPHSRSYSSLVRPTFYSILKQGSDGRISIGIEENRGDVKIKHQIPEHLLHYFIKPVYPRTETDIFEKKDPPIIGTCYMTDLFSLSSVNRSGMWNQRRPFLCYWGTVDNPCYLQVRFLHDGYDFSSASFYSRQKENNVLAAINFVNNGGDKHISIDRLKEGKFSASDLRLRFEFGNVNIGDLPVIPGNIGDPFTVYQEKLAFQIQLYGFAFDKLRGTWEKGSDNHSSWIDFVVYKGNETTFDLNKTGRAFLCFTFLVNSRNEKMEIEKPGVLETDGKLCARWNSMTLEIPVKPMPLPMNL